MSALSDLVQERMREALRKNLRDTTGDCVCDPAYTERRLIDPHCGWHDAEGTTDDDSVTHALSVLADPEVQAGIAGVLASVRAVHTPTADESEDRPYKTRCECGAWSYVHAAHVDRAGAEAVVARLTGEGVS